jgi:PhnB protein
MAKLSLSEQIDRAVDSVLASRDSQPPVSSPQLKPLVGIVAALHGLPAPEFRASLKNDLQRRATMASQASPAPQKVNYMREGFHTVTPYLLVAQFDEFAEFLKEVFGAVELFRMKDPKSGLVRHAEMRVGDSILQMAQGNEQFPPRQGALHVFVPDADAVYQRALEAGATSLHAPIDQPYGSREASVRDSFGHNWYIATYTAGKPGVYIPEGLRSVNVYLHPKGAAQLIEFMKNALGAEQVALHESGGSIVHAEMRIGDSVIELGEAHAQWQPMPMTLTVYVPDTDAAYARALAAGGKSLREPADQPYGDRSAGVADAFGNQWWLSTHLRDVEV